MGIHVDQEKHDREKGEGGRVPWRFRYLNIVGCLLKRRPTKGGGGVAGTPGPP